MERLIREQKIERRIARRQGSLYAAARARNMGYDTSPSSYAELSMPRRFASFVPRDRIVRQGGFARSFNAFAEMVVAKATNTDLCYVLGLFLATVLLSATLGVSGVIVNHTLQPPVFRLPQPIDSYLPVYASSQAVEASSANANDAQDYGAFQARGYVVQSGQTLSELAEIHNITMSTLVSFNEISNARGLQAGRPYMVPDREGVLHAVKNGETIEQIAERHQVNVNTLLDVNNLPVAFLEADQKIFIPGAVLSDFDLRLSLGELFARPVYGRQTSGFGYRRDPFSGVRRFHYGLDVAAPRGTPILASMEGRVSYIGDQSRGYGKYVIVRHPGGFQSLYAHMNGFNVRTGQQIVRGRTIGWVGNTGRSTGAHLHFAIIKDGKFVSPNNYLY